MMDTNHPFANGGMLTHWEIYADGVNPVQLVIYRNQGGSFIEVGRSPLVTPVLGYNLFPLPPQLGITVQAGDFVGAYSPGPTGSISFSVEGSAGNCDNYGGTLIGFTPGSTTFACPVNRIYSLRAFRQP